MSGNAATATTANAVSFNGGLTTSSSPTFTTLTLSQATGTAPLTVSSSTEVTNLNANYLEGHNAAYFYPASNPNGYGVGDITGVNAGTGIIGGGSSGTVTLGIDTATWTNITQRAPYSTGYGSGFYQTNNATTDQGWPQNASWYHLLNVQHTNTANNYAMQFAGNFYNSNDIYYRETNNNGAGPWYKVWHSGNDGSGSGLDADLLDGQHGSYYQNAGNLNAGTIASARVAGSYTGITGVGIIAAGTWQGAAIADTYISSAATWNGKAGTGTATCPSGQVAQNVTTTTGGVSVQCVTPAGGVTGSGTATQVAYWSSGSALTGSSNLYWDSSNNRLGVGTSGPSQSIDTTGNIRNRGGNFTDSGDTTRLAFSSGNVVVTVG